MDRRDDTTRTHPPPPPAPPAESVAPGDFDIPPGSRLDWEGLIAALLILQDFSAKAEKGLYGAVEEMSPKSRPERGATIRSVVGSAVAGNDRQSLASASRRLSLLLGAVLGGIPVGAQQVGEDVRLALSPSEIEAAVGDKPGKCWEEFKRRWEAFSSEGLDERMRRTIGEAIAKLLP